MRITNKILKDYEKLQDEISSLRNVVSESIKTVKDQNEEREVEVPILEGGDKTVELKEKVLWQEMYHLGTGDNRAANYLRETYPDIFEGQEKLHKLAEELKKFEHKSFGFDHTQMTMLNIIKIAEAVANKQLKIKE